MATKEERAGIKHPTTVPANFEPDESGEHDVGDSTESHT